MVEQLHNGPISGGPKNGPGILSSRSGARIAYHALAGKSPGIVFFHGFRSDMNGDKALAVEALARAKGQAFLRFDAFGHGQSTGHYTEGTIGLWASQAIEILDKLTRGPQILVGSSYGGWIALLAAKARPDRIHALVGLAAAPDFTQDMMEREFSDEQRQELEDKGQVQIPNCYAPLDPWIIPKRLIEEAREHLVLTGPIVLDCPVRLIHGQMDEDVPWQTSIKTAEVITGSDVQITLIKDGGHRLSRPQDLARIHQTIGELL